MVDDAFGHWLAGFVDGEGCFWMQPSGRNIRCGFRVCVRGDDVGIIEEIHAKTGLGYVRKVPRRHDSDQVEWVVYRKPECLSLVRLFERYPLRAKKLRDFAVWSRAVEIWQSYYKGQRYADWFPMWVLYRQLREVRSLGAGEPFAVAEVAWPIDPVEEQDKVIADLWREGLTCVQIGPLVGLSDASVNQRLKKLRAAGAWNLPKRYTGSAEGAIREARAEVFGEPGLREVGNG